MTGNERTTPLDPQEQALARRWRALPDGEPAAALDARIRAQAHAAAQASRPKVRPWAWGLSTAAAAVLAIGMLWQSGLPPTSEEAMYRHVPGPPPEPVEALFEQEQASTVAADAGNAEGVRSEAAPTVDREPAPQAELQDAAQPFGKVRESAAPERAVQARRMPAPRKALAPPEPVYVPDLPTRIPPPQAKTVAPPPAPPAADAPAAMQAAPEPAAAPPPPPAPVGQDLRRRDEARSREPAPSTPSRRQAGALAGSAPATQPGEAPQAWIARIDALLEDGERVQALAELRDFVAAHPDYRLPRRLRALLDDAR